MLIPGYGAGAGFYFRNLADLCSRFRTYAVDVLGTGLSGACPVIIGPDNISRTYPAQ